MEALPTARDVVEVFDHATYVYLPDSNQSEALNEGFRRANGDIICWLNTDDILLPGAFATAITELEKHGPRTYFTSHYLMVDENLSYCVSIECPTVVSLSKLCRVFTHQRFLHIEYGSPGRY